MKHSANYENRYAENNSQAESHGTERHPRARRFSIAQPAQSEITPNRIRKIFAKHIDRKNHRSGTSCAITVVDVTEEPQPRSRMWFWAEEVRPAQRRRAVSLCAQRARLRS